MAVGAGAGADVAVGTFVTAGAGFGVEIAVCVAAGFATEPDAYVDVFDVETVAADLEEEIGFDSDTLVFLTELVEIGFEPATEDLAEDMEFTDGALVILAEGTDEGAMLEDAGRPPSGAMEMSPAGAGEDMEKDGVEVFELDMPLRNVSQPVMHDNRTQKPASKLMFLNILS